ncbi:D-Ala-D-Ala carboxypeptidase family metallohydrolase [Pseudomonas sp. R5(2019)]|uniref:D-Ala-D-Ala carboxypeptidase family metallohydrolase n=1 Tax=Pseudomonas sp. R5(2019) TaxID=2697566 RepID=UPI001412B564|nr:D-Ala-D-Ala carboxypeptidase family metallohydrolase [Pseudomonas sp. R5(2019)]NBA93830.1 DUF882 domain-containing protein [Pseudomonas sp. R5(2019)]
MYLTKFFTLDELTVSETAARKGIDNQPDALVLARLKRLAAFLEEIRGLVKRPILVSSGYRSPSLNRLIGGAARSAHMSGLAADISAPGVSPRELAALIADSDLEFDQVILEFDRWVHVGLAEGTARRQVLTARKGLGYRAGLV